MIDDPLDYQLVTDPFWLDGDDLTKREDFSTIMVKHEAWVCETFTTESIKERNKAIWILCEEHGVTPGTLRSSIDRDESGLLRRIQDGAAPDFWYALALKMAGLEPDEYMKWPDLRQQFHGKLRTVEKFRHKCLTVRMEPIDADRRATDKLSPAHGALLQVVLKDGHTQEEWHCETNRFASDLRMADGDSKIKRYLSKLYCRATEVPCLDRASLICLEQWSEAGASDSLGRIAQAWNRYQMHWFLATEVIDAI